MAAVMSQTLTLPPSKQNSDGQETTVLPLLSSVTGPSGTAFSLFGLPRAVLMKVWPWQAPVKEPLKFFTKTVLT